MKHTFTLLFILLLGAAQAQTSKEVAVINSVMKALETFQNQEFPGGDTVRVNPLGSYREADFLRRYRFYKAEHAKLKALDSKKLSFNDQINLELLIFQLQEELSNYEFQAYLNPILSDEGFHISLVGNAEQIYSTKTQLEHYLAILKAMPAYVDQHLELMRRGLAFGISQPKIALLGYENTYNMHIVDTLEKSRFWKPFSKKPSGITEADWQAVVKEGRVLVQKNAIDSYRKIKAFFENEYFPKTRTTLGAIHLPNGQNFYADRVKYYTSTQMTPEEVFQIGMNEVERIKKEMQVVLEEANFKGTIQEFIQYLRTDPQFYPTTAEQLIKEASYIAKKVDGQLPRLFGKLPRQPYGVEPVPDFLAPTYTGGRYNGASIHSKRAGFYWVNTYNLKSRTLYTLEALTLHEAAPGHHLQISLTQELENLPNFRRNLYINAFGEGWGLYGEYLGYELGLYKDPYSRFGRLTYEMWRACRLVIDVGIHSKDWTRDQAVSFLADNTALSLHEVNTEINRYICWPGQALAYKIGEIQIKRLRQKAEAQLKERFDVRTFHDLVLSQGTVTMAILEKMVDRYILSEQKKAK